MLSVATAQDNTKTLSVGKPHNETRIPVHPKVENGLFAFPTAAIRKKI